MEERSFGPVRFLPGPKDGRYPYCHSVYIEQAGVLIDPASDRDYLKKMKDNGEVKMVWLTHWHEDHIMHLDLFRDIPLWISEQDAPPLGDLDVFIDWYGMENTETDEMFRQMMIDQFHFQPRVPDRLLKDGEVINLGNVTVEVIGTPGHTPGHLAFYFIEPAVLMMGDIDLTPFGPWYGDRYSSIEQLIESTNRLREIPAKVRLACHETGVFEETPDQLWDDYLQVIQTREDKLLEHLKEPRTMDDIINAWIVYGKPKEPQDFWSFGEMGIMRKHLEILMEKGIVAYENDHYKIK